ITTGRLMKCKSNSIARLPTPTSPCTTWPKRAACTTVLRHTWWPSLVWRKHARFAAGYDRMPNDEEHTWSKDALTNMEPQSPRKRRPRYSGTHPKQFDQRYKELDPASFPEIQAHVRAQGRTPAGTHLAVLVEEVLARLRPQPGEIVADCTIGYGGHALEF